MKAFHHLRTSLNVVVVLLALPFIIGQGCPNAANDILDDQNEIRDDPAPADNDEPAADQPFGGPIDPSGTWSVGLKMVAIPNDAALNPNGIKEGAASLETWAFVDTGATTTLNITSGSTTGSAVGALTTDGVTFRFEGDNSDLDALGIHQTILVEGTFTGPDNIEGTKRVDFYSLSAAWLGLPPQFVGFESATFTGQRN